MYLGGNPLLPPPSGYPSGPVSIPGQSGIGKGVVLATFGTVLLFNILPFVIGGVIIYKLVRRK